MKEKIMELYLFLSFVVIYLISSFFISKQALHKIWTLAFILSFIATSIAIAFLRMNNQDVMMNADQLNWYYILYLFGSMSVVLGVINLWMYRGPLWRNLFGKGEEEEDDNNV